jgi:putative endonuclease
MALQRRAGTTAAFLASNKKIKIMRVRLFLSASGGGGEAANRMPFEVYVLKSERDGKRYVGSGEDADERLRRHNKGEYQFTKGHRPWHIVHRESYETRSEAVRRERFLKTGQGRKWLDENNIHSGIV